MNVLEKILEEIEKEKNSYIADHAWNYFKGLEYAEEIIRSHMDDVSDVCGKRLIDANALDNEVMNFFLAITGNPKQTTVVRECKESFRRMINEQPTVNVDDNWIPVEERLPEEHDSMFAKFKGTDKWSNAMFEKKSDEVNVTIEFEDGARKTITSYTLDGRWKCEKEIRITKVKVIAWQPLPEPYGEDL